MSNEKNNWPSAESVTERLLLRDWYTNARLYFVLRINVSLAVLVLLTLFLTISILNRPPQFRYVIASDAGIVLDMVPLTDSNHDNEYVVKWAIDAVTRLYSFDFVNYRDQFQTAKGNMLNQGWLDFEKAMEVSGNFNAVIGNKFVTTAVPTGPGKVVKEGDVAGRYAWKVEFPMLISYRSSYINREGKQRNTSQQLNVAVTVVRQPEFLNESGLGIRAIVAE